MQRNIVSETDIAALLAAFWPQSVRLVPSGHNRMNAFVDFPSKEHSRAVLEHYVHGLVLETGNVCYLEYARPRISESKQRYADWICQQCGVLNFSRRMKCFQCGLERDSTLYSSDTMITESQEEVIGKYDSKTPTSSLVVYNLSKFSSETDLAAILRPYAPVKEVQLLRDASGTTKRVGFVSFVNAQAATHTLKAAQANSLELDGSKLVLAYSAGPVVAQVLAQAISRRRDIQAHTAAAAAAALSLPQPTLHTTPRTNDWPPVFEHEGAAAYHFDAASGYFYEPLSGFYYDPKQKFYFNAHTRDYYRHTPDTNPPFTKFQPPSTAQPTDETTALPTQDKATLSLPEQTKKNDHHNTIPPPQQATSKTSNCITKSGPITFGLLKSNAIKHSSSTLASPSSHQHTQPQSRHALSQILAVGTDYQQLHRLSIDTRPAVAFCDKNQKWLCLVSRRQFISEDQLKTHVAKSQLYKDALQQAAQNNLIALH